MRLSIVIPAYNEAEYLGDCLTSVLAEIQRTANSGEIEVLVIDNASTDHTCQVARGFPAVRVVSEPLKGLTRARQKGLSEARGNALAFVDADTRMPPGWIDRVLRAFETDPLAVCVSGPYIYYDASSFNRVLVKLYWRLLAKPAYWITGYMAVGGNFTVSKEALLQIGGFDTTIAFYGEDTNIARRLAAVGEVRFHLRLPIYTSARRLHREGFWWMAMKYGANFISEILLKRPVTRSYCDVR
jgi:glycosyltransferase involved in cell wall biosynthesis